MILFPLPGCTTGGFVGAGPAAARVPWADVFEAEAVGCMRVKLGIFPKRSAHDGSADAAARRRRAR